MPTANERTALWFLAFVAVSGSGVRLWRANQTTATAAESSTLERQIGRVDSVRAARHNPSRPGKPRAESRAPTDESREPRAVDLDQATAAQIEALPGIGPSLAARIVANRDSAGAFGYIDALCDVRGVGPSLVAKLGPLVTFTGPRRPESAACGGASNKARKTRTTRSPQPR